MDQFDIILDIDWLSNYQPVIDYARRRVSLFTKSGHIVYQASQHAIRPSPILKSLPGDRRH